MKSTKLSSRPFRLIIIPIVLGALSFGLGRCTSAKKKMAHEAGDATWAGSMQSMAQNLEQLMPYVFGREEYLDPKNKEVIEELLAQFASAAERVPKHAGESMLGKDPIIQYSLSRLKNNSKQALISFKEGQTDFSRSVARENIGLCFGCHSTQNFGPQYSFSTRTLTSAFRIFPIEKADYYVATRQFDKALEVLEGVVKSPSHLLDDPHGQLNALRKYLYIQVRVKNNPGPAATLVDSYLSWDKLPYFMAADARAWSDSLAKWQNEKKDSGDALARAQKLIQRAETQQTGGYQAGLVDMLRASALLHEWLLVAKTPQLKAQAYRLLGETYDALSEVDLWQLPEFYFEACVRTVPNSKEAIRCYKDFERSIILGYSGSAGTFIPKEERNLMYELKVLSGLKAERPQDDKSDPSGAE